MIAVRHFNGLALSLLALVLSDSAVSQPTALDSTARSVLPEGSEKALIVEYCVSCHTASRIARAGGGVEEWSDRVLRMKRWGSKLPNEDIPKVAAYLAKSFPVRVRADAIQASASEDFTLTTATASVRSIETWVRVAGQLDATRRVLTASLDGRGSEHATVGDRARVFSMDARSSMQQAKVTAVRKAATRSVVEVTLTAPARIGGTVYLAEIVTDLGSFLTIPNEAIIEEENRQVVYVREGPDRFVPRQIATGIQGERYTQVLQGLSDGEDVVVIGSFFVDAEYRLKGFE